VRIEPGTRALVTGGSRGAGFALARALVDHGATVGLIARSRTGVTDAAAELGFGTLALPADVADRASLTSAVRAYEAETGRIDLLVVAAAIPGSALFLDQTTEELRRLVDVNVRGALHTVRAALPGMVRRGHGHVVLLGCHAGIHGMPGTAAYGATRSALSGLAGPLAAEVAGHGIGVTSVVAGELDTGFHDAERDRLPGWQRTEEAADPDELASAVLHAVERGARTLYFPEGEVANLARLSGLPPRMYEFLLRQVRGPDAAPRR
jgi:NADP-dependent 3-hydroxy acid dehydrogenase YdfG